MKSTDAYQQENVKNSTGHLKIDCWQRNDLEHQIQDEVAEEVPIALVYNGISHVVMMASPKDLEAPSLAEALASGLLPTWQESRDLYASLSDPR